MYVRCILIAVILGHPREASAWRFLGEIHGMTEHTLSRPTLLPTVWFTSLNQWMLGRTHSTTAMLGKQALICNGSHVCPRPLCLHFQLPPLFYVER